MNENYRKKRESKEQKESFPVYSSGSVRDRVPVWCGSGHTAYHHPHPRSRFPDPYPRHPHVGSGASSTSCPPRCCRRGWCSRGYNVSSFCGAGPVEESIQ